MQYVHSSKVGSFLVMALMMSLLFGLAFVVNAAPKEKVIRMFAQAYTPKERTAADRWDPPKYFWTIEKEYEQLHPDVDIQFLEMPSADYNTFITTRLAGQLAPEVFWWQTHFVNIHYKKGWLVDFTPYLNKPNPYVKGNKAWKDIFVPGVLETSVAPDGKYYILQADGSWLGIYYNKTLFKELGLSVPNTWKEFMAVQAKIKGAGYTPFAITASSANPWAVGWAIRCIQDMVLDSEWGEIKGTGKYLRRGMLEGAAITQKELVQAIKKGTYSALDPQWQEQLRLLKEWSQFWPPGFLADIDTYRLFVSGKAAMMWDGTYALKPLDHDPLRKFEYGVMQFPTITKESSPYATGIAAPALGGFFGAAAWCIPTSAEKSGLVDTAVDWLTNVCDSSSELRSTLQ